jgi:hypothetical protein
MFFVGRESVDKFLQLMHHPSLRLFGLIMAWRVFAMIFPSIQLMAVNLLYPGLGYH